MDDGEIRSNALTMARRALTILEEQAAGYTALTIPVHLQLELEEKRREVTELEARIVQGTQPIQQSTSATLRSRLDRLDDVEIETLCMDHFPQVYDKFSRGLRRDEKINLLLDHCLRNPRARERLTDRLAAGMVDAPSGLPS